MDATLMASPSITTTASFHRGDPLDIPLIDDHLLTRLLLPRIISAIRFVLPRVYMDWTTGTTTAIAPSTQNDNNFRREDRSMNDDQSSINHDTLVWKRIVEGILQTCLVLGSCHHVYSRRRNSSSSKGGMNEAAYHVTTPAMHSLGMFLQPTATIITDARSNRNGNRGKNNPYGKVFSLVVATVIIPNMYQWLKYRRRRQLEQRERQLRWEELRREFRSSLMGGQSQQERQQQQQQLQRSQHMTLQQRARQRKSLISSFITDTILGMGDVFLPPLCLANHLAYLWGMSYTPHLGMRLAGWEYASVTAEFDSSDEYNVGIGTLGMQGHHHQRHANFQYGNRRLMVEEALRTVSMMLPPRNIENGAGLGGGAAGADVATGGRLPGSERNGGPMNDGDGIASRSGEERLESRGGSGGMLSRMNSMAHRTVGNRNGWMRRRFLSFMGVAEDNDNDANSTSAAASEERRYSLTCSMCHVENPSIPYIASCGHCYCYLCLRTAVTDDLMFRCTDCGQLIESSGRPKS